MKQYIFHFNNGSVLNYFGKINMTSNLIYCLDENGEVEYYIPLRNLDYVERIPLPNFNCDKNKE